MSDHQPTRETRDEAWQRRKDQAGAVDFTMMYAAHDAFNRDLARMEAAALMDDPPITARFLATWRTFSKQLHTHHRAEDAALWPRLRAVSDTDEQQILDAMEAEHGALDPLLKTIETAIEDRDVDTLISEVTNLRNGLAAHMVHEETAALPLLERRLGQAGWDDFGKHIRDEVGGMSGAAEYLPWVLQDTSPEVQRTILGLLPAPARLIYRRRWAPKYRKAVRL